MGINLARKHSSDDNEFVIQLDYHKDSWYFVKLDEDINTAVWHSNINSAQKFTSSQGIADFCAIYLSERRYNIVRLK